ncbi:hypothetical protein, partial [Acidisoma sp. S159]|uniref:hypothetical protein n=1 Tax=Acidisoma sp. S159 TaxID=1747225 RepID=UPI001C2028DE
PTTAVFLKEGGFDATEVATGNDAAVHPTDVDDVDLVSTGVAMFGEKDGIDLACASASFIPKSR